MAYYPQPLTKLEAINIALSSMGEPAINALDDAGVDAQMASDLIDETSRTVQLKGWHWNREKHTISPDRETGSINLPNNVAKVDTVDGSSDIDVVQRGLRLFDRGTNSYTFTSPLVLELYVILPFEELPLSCRSFIAYSAAMILQQRLLGADGLDANLKARSAEAYAELVRDDIQVSDPNMLRDNWSTQGIVARGYFGRGAFR